MFQTEAQNSQYQCVWYGQCGKNSFNQLPINCKYSGPAKHLSTEGQPILAKHCPHLLKDIGHGINTCCDFAQLKTFDESIGLAANFLNRCPSCFTNLKRHICDMSCSADQSRFINVSESEIQEGLYHCSNIIMEQFFSLFAHF